MPARNATPADGDVRLGSVGVVNAVDLRERVGEQMKRAQEELAELVGIRSVADDRLFPPEECLLAAEWVRTAFEHEGFADARLLATPDGSNAVFGSRPSADPLAPTVLLYAHYDVQSPKDEKAWRTPPFELTERNGRWYGRGAADCKGNIIMHLTALRALGADSPVNLKVIVEGSRERGTGGLDRMVPEYAGLLQADAILVADTGNLAVGVPAVTVSVRGMVNVVVTVEALASEIHSGRFAGPAPDALGALIRILGTLRDEAGNTNVMGLDNMQSWTGALYASASFRDDAGVLDGVALLGNGAVADSLWARPAVTVLGIDCPSVAGSTSAIQPRARARINLCIPPRTDIVKAERALIGHLNAVVPWGVRLSVELEGSRAPFLAQTGGPAYLAMGDAMRDAYGEDLASLGRGDSFPLCTVFAETFPDAEIILLGVEEPQAAMHVPNESVDPTEIATMALAEALFLQRYGRV
jgi:acetylornithine deacetylase/succinyl-diaminopimelate desuccinylase-like protein